MKRIILDFDNTVGIKGRPMDDALALLYLLGRSDEVEIAGICCNYGNGTVSEVYECTSRFLREIGMERIPVFSGSEREDTSISEASRFIAEESLRASGGISYLGLGSLGNLYGAYLLDSSVYDRIDQIVLMGGITEPLYIHESRHLDELNFSINSKAAVNVLSLGRNVSVITGNNCLPVSELPKDEFLSKLCTDNNATGMYIAQTCGYRFKDKEVVFGASSSYCWDAVAACYLLRPELFAPNECFCNINSVDMTRGFLHPAGCDESNSCINIPVPLSRESLQNEIYEGWLKLDINTSNTHYSCNGLYLDKLIQPAILIELREAPAHGLKLLNSLKGKSMIEDSIDQTGFYRTLKRMEKDGLIVRLDETESKRRVYQITDFGRLSLANWKRSLIIYRKHIDRIIDMI